MPSTFTEWTAELANAPNYYVLIDGVATKQYSVHPVKGSTFTNVICLQIPDGSAATLAPLQNRATWGDAEIPFLDINGELTDLVSTEKASPTLSTLTNRRVTIYEGYRPLSQASYQPAMTGEIRQVKYEGHGLYVFQIVGLTRRLDDQLMKDLTGVVFPALAATAALGATQIELDQVEGGFPTGTMLLHRADGSQTEVVTVTGVNTTDRKVTLATGLSRAWAAGDILTNAPHLRGNLVNLYYSLLTGTFSTDPTTAFPLHAVHGAPQGLGLAAADIDTAQLAAVRDQMLGEITLDFLFTGPVAGKKFFQEQLFSLGCYPVIRGDGTIGLRVFVPPGPETAIASIPKLHKEHMAEFPSAFRRINEHVNRVEVSGDHHLGQVDPVALATLEDTADQTATGETGLLQIASEGLRSGLDGVAIAREFAARILNRWKVPPWQVDVDVLFTKRALAPGDIVSVSHPSLPDSIAGALGLTDRLMEVVHVQPKWRQGRVALSFLDSAFRKYSWVAPSGAPDYGAATADDKQYAYYGDTNNKVNSGADEGYETF